MRARLVPYFFGDDAFRSSMTPRTLLFAALLPLLSPVAAASEQLPSDAVQVYASLAGKLTAECAGRQVVLPLDASALTRRPGDGTQRHWVYPMRYKQITEGWNWHPEAVRDGGDYYRFSYLPLASTDEWRGSYRAEDKIGEGQDFKVHWRYDYFIGFDNLPVFADALDDLAGFDFTLPAGVDPVAMTLLATLQLQAPCVAESTTFWKATHAQPEDFTLKKRYLLGKIKSLHLVGAQASYRIVLTP